MVGDGRLSLQMETYGVGGFPDMEYELRVAGSTLTATARWQGGRGEEQVREVVYRRVAD